MPPTESFIVTHFNEVVSLIIAAAMGWAGKTLYATIQEQKALKKAVKALLHDRLYQSCRYYIQQGYVDSEGLTNVGLVYEAYHELKGNGTGTNLYERDESTAAAGRPRSLNRRTSKWRNTPTQVPRPGREPSA